MFIYISKKKNIPVLVFFHGWHSQYEASVEKWLKTFFKKTFLNADGFVVLSKLFKAKLEKLGIKAPIYVETTTISEQILLGFSLEKKLDLLAKAPHIKILFLSRLERTKGIFETLEAFKIILDKGYDVSLSIAGEGSAKKKVSDYLTKNDLDNKKVKMLGYIRGENKKEVLHSHQIYCFPTYGEGMPISLLETMATGMAVITRPVGGIRDFFQHGKMGYMTESKDPFIIAELIEKTILNKKNMIEMARYNHFYARENFLADKVASRLINIYKDIVS
jgi:glycosyltransferase involved in cell wall biosynthesis